MIAEIAGKAVARFINRDWPNDAQEVYEIIQLAANKAWKEGKWWGMTAELTVPIFQDCQGRNYIMAPPSHPILLAMNADGRPVDIRDKYFEFHRNGMGDVTNRPGCTWIRDVFDIGSTPYFDKNNINFEGGVLLGARSLGPSREGEKVFIDGAYTNGDKVYSYSQKDYGFTQGCNLKSLEVTTNGIHLNISQNFNYISDVRFSDIKSITKTTTASPVEIIAVDCDNRAWPIARLEPNDVFSSYRKYLVPDCLCNRSSIHGIFKIAKQGEIRNPTDPIIINDIEALINLCKSIDMMYYKENLDAGSAYFVNAINSLEKEKREQESPTESPIQVSIMANADIPNILKHYS
jgi:hypothetical protein